MIDGLLTYKIVANLNNKILDGKIQKIYQINDNEMIFKIRSNRTNYNLINCIEAKSFRLHLSQHTYPTLQQATNLTMVFRKQLEGGIIKSIKQFNNERVIIFEIVKLNELRDEQTKYLIFELLSRHSNTILCDSDFSIISTMKFVPIYQSNTRLMAKSSIYQNIDTKNKINPFIEIENSDDYLNNYQGFSKQLNQEFIFQNMQGINAKDLLNKYKTSNKFYVYPNIISSIPLKTNENLIATYDDLDQAFDMIYASNSQNNSITNLYKKEIKVIKSTIKKNNKKIEKLEQQYLENADYLHYQKIGTLLYDNIYQFNKNDHYDSVKLLDYDSNKEETILLDNKISYANNAKKYLLKYNKLKRSFVYLDEQISQAKKQNQLLLDLIESLDYIRVEDLIEMITYLENKNIIKLVNKKYKSKKQDKMQILKYYYKDAVFLVGKNAIQNDYVSFKLANKDDYFFHIKDMSGAHVILKGELNDDTINIGAKLAIYYASTKINTDYEVDYTQVKNIKKVKNANLGQVSMDTYKSIKVINDPIEINKLEKEYQDIKKNK